MEDSTTPDIAAIDDLVTERMDGVGPSTSDIEAAASPEPAPEPVQETSPPAAEPPPQPSEVAPPSQTQTPAEQPTPPARIKLGDREYTPEELQAALTTASQFPHLQNKYAAVLEAQRQQPQQAQGQPQTQNPQVSAQQALMTLRAKYDPIVQEAVKSGLIEQDFATLFPGMAAQLLAYRDSFGQVAQQAQMVAQTVMQGQRQSQSQGVVQRVGQSIAQLAQSGEAFSPLKEPGQAQAFFNYLWELNPQMGHLNNPNFLASQWVAFNKDKFLQNAQNQAINQQKQLDLRFARADATTGTRAPGMSQPQQKSPLDEMVEDFNAWTAR